MTVAVRVLPESSIAVKVNACGPEARYGNRPERGSIPVGEIAAGNAGARSGTPLYTAIELSGALDSMP